MTSSENHALEYFEMPWLKRQVENHIFFGFLSRRLPFFWVLLAVGLCSIVFYVRSEWPSIGNSLSIVLCFGLSIFFIRRLSVYHQAVIGWVVCKSVVSLVALLLIIVAFPVSLSKGQSDAWPNLLLGIIWLSPIGFVPSLISRQKYVMLCRLALSVPALWLGITSGYWH
jgi:hypothetical protein